MTHPRNLIVAEEDSQLTVVEDYVSLGGGAGALQHGHGTGCRAITAWFRTT